MSYETLWTKYHSLNKMMTGYLENYGNVLKWKDYKETILHEGCVDGTLTKEVLFPFVKPHARKLVAIENSKDVIDWAKEHNQLEGVEYRALDMSDDGDLLKINEKFDHIFSFFTSEWRTESKSWLKEFAKLLNTDGQIFMQAFVDSGIHRCFKNVASDEKWSKYLPQKEVFANYTDDPIAYFRNEAEAGGFKVDLLKIHKGSFKVENSTGKLKSWRPEIKYFLSFDYIDSDIFKRVFRQGVVMLLIDFSEFIRHILNMYYKHWNHIPVELHESYLQQHISDFCEGCVYLGETGKYEMSYQEIVAVLTKV